MNGSFRGNGISLGGFGDQHFFVNWQLAGQDVAGNFSLINWQAYFHFNRADAQLTNGVVNTNVGQVYANGGTVKPYQGTFTTRNHHIASGTVRVNHRADGNAEFQMSGGVSVPGGRSEGTSPVWSLPTIPRQSNPTFSKNLYTLGERIVVNMNRKAGFTHRGSVQIPDGNVIKEFRDQTDAWAWTPDESEIEEIYRRMPNTLKTTLGVDITTWNGGTQIGGVGWQNAEIQLDSSRILPEFSNFDFTDSVASVTRITGNSKIFIQGFSKPRVEILPANKMISKKFASPVKYVFSTDGVSLERNFSNQSVSAVFERAVSSSGSLAISASAVDSRGLSTAVSKNVEVLPYSAPSLSVRAKRQNNFDEITEIDISGAISALKVGNANKNAVLSLKMRHRAVNGSWGAWKSLSAVMNDANFSVSKQFLSLNRAESFEIEVLIADKLSETSQIVRVDSGKPIFFISDNKEKVGVNKVPEFGDLDVAGDVYSRGKKLGGGTHIGQVIISTSLKTPEAVSAEYGGTWVLWGQGRTIIGVGSNGETNYTEAEQTGGWDRVRLHSGNLPIMSYGASFHAQENGTVIYNTWGNMDRGTTIGGKYQNGNNRGGAHSRTLAFGFGNDESHETRSKYITAYFWKKTAN